MGQLARSEEPAQPPVPSGGQVLSPWVPERGAGRGWQRAGPRAFTRAREISGRHSPRELGARKGFRHQPPHLALQRHWELPHCHLRDRGGACGAGFGARESAAAASNPPLSSLRLRHARSASRARRAAVAARRSQRGRGCAQGQRGARVRGARQGVGRLRERGS